MAKSRPNVKSVNLKMKEIGCLRAAILNSLHNEIDRDRSRSKSEVIRKFLDDYNSGILYPPIFLKLGRVSRSTLYSWDQTLREGGVDALVPRYGSVRRPEITENEKRMMIQLVLMQNRIQIRFIISLSKFLLEQRGLESPSRAATMRRWLVDFRTRSKKSVWDLLYNSEESLRYLFKATGEEHGNG